MRAGYDDDFAGFSGAAALAAPAAANSSFQVSRLPSGRWSVRRRDGLVGGLFFEEAGALGFVRREGGRVVP